MCSIFYTCNLWEIRETDLSCAPRLRELIESLQWVQHSNTERTRAQIIEEKLCKYLKYNQVMFECFPNVRNSLKKGIIRLLMDNIRRRNSPLDRSPLLWSWDTFTQRLDPDDEPMWKRIMVGMSPRCAEPGLYLDCRAPSVFWSWALCLWIWRRSNWGVKSRDNEEWRWHGKL